MVGNRNPTELWNAFDAVLQSLTSKVNYADPVLVSGLTAFVLTGQQPAVEGVFTAAQAEAGRISYIDTCARRHTYSLRGRKGEEGELPAVGSLSEAPEVHW